MNIHFRQLNAEMFYRYNWDNYNIDELIQETTNRVQRYCHDRIKTTPSVRTPSNT